MRRTLLGLSQETLADSLGLTFQQVQKYERGTNRVSSSRLFDLCRILKVPVAYFFDEMAGDVAKQSPGALQGKAPSLIELDQDPAATERVETTPTDEAGGPLDAGERDASSMADPDGASGSQRMMGEKSQAVGKIARVGVLRPGDPPPGDFGHREAFEAGLRDHGFSW